MISATGFDDVIEAEQRNRRPSRVRRHKACKPKKASARCMKFCGSRTGGACAAERYCDGERQQRDRAVLLLMNSPRKAFALNRLSRAVNQLSDPIRSPMMPVAVGRPRITIGSRDVGQYLDKPSMHRCRDRRCVI